MFDITNHSTTLKHKRIYCKATIYFCADIAYTDDSDLNQNIENLKLDICSNLDDIYIDSFDSNFAYDGVTITNKSKIPANILNILDD